VACNKITRQQEGSVMNSLRLVITASALLLAFGSAASAQVQEDRRSEERIPRREAPAKHKAEDKEKSEDRTETSDKSEAAQEERTESTHEVLSGQPAADDHTDEEETDH
jgi:hypothetical protein